MLLNSLTCITTQNSISFPVVPRLHAKQPPPLLRSCHQLLRRPVVAVRGSRSLASDNKTESGKGYVRTWYLLCFFFFVCVSDVLNLEIEFVTRYIIYMIYGGVNNGSTPAIRYNSLRFCHSSIYMKSLNTKMLYFTFKRNQLKLNELENLTD